MESAKRREECVIVQIEAYAERYTGISSIRDTLVAEHYADCERIEQEHADAVRAWETLNDMFEARKQDLEFSAQLWKAVTITEEGRAFIANEKLGISRVSDPQTAEECEKMLAVVQFVEEKVHAFEQSIFGEFD